MSYGSQAGTALAVSSIQRTHAVELSLPSTVWVNGASGAFSSPRATAFPTSKPSKDPSRRYSVQALSPPSADRGAPAGAAIGASFGWSEDELLLQDDSKFRFSGVGELVLDLAAHEGGWQGPPADPCFNASFWGTPRLDSADSTVSSPRMFVGGGVSAAEATLPTPNFRFIDNSPLSPALIPSFSEPRSLLEGTCTFLRNENTKTEPDFSQQSAFVDSQTAAESEGRGTDDAGFGEELLGEWGYYGQLKKGKGKSKGRGAEGTTSRAERKPSLSRGGSMVSRSKKVKSEEVRRQEERRRAGCFKLLGVERNASLDEIRQAYRTLSRKFHPDVNKDPDAAALFLIVQQAYKVVLSTWQQQQQREQEFSTPDALENSPPVPAPAVELRSAVSASGLDRKSSAPSSRSSRAGKTGRADPLEAFWDDLVPGKQVVKRRTADVGRLPNNSNAW